MHECRACGRIARVQSDGRSILSDGVSLIDKGAGGGASDWCAARIEPPGVGFPAPRIDGLRTFGSAAACRAADVQRRRCSRHHRTVGRSHWTGFSGEELNTRVWQQDDAVLFPKLGLLASSTVPELFATTEPHAEMVSNVQDPERNAEAMARRRSWSIDGHPKYDEVLPILSPRCRRASDGISSGRP